MVYRVNFRRTAYFLSVGEHDAFSLSVNKIMDPTCIILLVNNNIVKGVLFIDSTYFTIKMTKITFPTFAVTAVDQIADHIRTH